MRGVPGSLLQSRKDAEEESLLSSLASLQMCVSEGASALGELEALPSTLATVLLAFLHAAVARKIAGVAKALRHGDDAGFAIGALSRGGRGGFDQAEHDLQGAGDSLGDGAGLS